MELVIFDGSKKHSITDQPYAKTSPPEGLNPHLHITLDEFYLFNPLLEVKKLSSRDKTSETCTVSEAVKNIHQHKHSRCSYSFSLSADDKLDDMFKLPSFVEEKDLYTQFWPNKTILSYHKERSKMFYCFRDKYQSHFRQAYGGANEWLSIISGKISVIVIKPTASNLSKVATCDQVSSFEVDQATVFKFSLKQKHFLFIPPGWISFIEAKRDTFAIGGQFLGIVNIKDQLEQFSDSTDNCSSEHLDIDHEIRTLYWLFAGKIITDKRWNEYCFRKDSITSLKLALMEWKAFDVMFKKYTKSSCYAPAGLKIDKIVKDLATIVSHNRFQAK